MYVFVNLLTLVHSLFFDCYVLVFAIESLLFICSFRFFDGMSSPRQALILRYPILAGVPPGGSQPYVDATALIAFGRLYHTHYNALAYSFLSVARVLPLLHVPRFPFHDSTGLCRYVLTCAGVYLCVLMCTNVS